MDADALNPGGSAPGRRSGSGTGSIAVYLVQSRSTQAGPHKEHGRGALTFAPAAQAHADLLAKYHLTVREAGEAVERYRATVVVSQERLRALLEATSQSTSGPKAA